ncbi:MAG: hypothetical protein J0H92_13980 [Sphingobacteriales bacterium]|jgi:hypothetical protein|nr:hypothetical protein [Sphingobacteriales bacterium]NCT76416.1 hypothetical protein [Chitinophagaceae bacterium]OJW33681.1 MAG: hypothetical protein BGO54_10615 [Sphingobacteriales bacterium 46-32]
MKWETVTSTIGHSAFALWNNGKKLMTLVFNPASNAARVESGAEKRVFLIRKEGFLRSRTVLRSEYGICLGRTGSENNQQFVEVGDQRFFYEVEEGKALTIYQESLEHPLAVCELDRSVASEQPASGIPGSQAISVLLMTLCWYLLPAIRDNRLLQQ